MILRLIVCILTRRSSSTQEGMTISSRVSKIQMQAARVPKAAMSIAASVDGTPMTRSDFIVDDATVENLTFSDPGPDPYPLPSYTSFLGKKIGSASVLQIDKEGV